MLEYIKGRIVDRKEDYIILENSILKRYSVGELLQIIEEGDLDVLRLWMMLSVLF